MLQGHTDKVNNVAISSDAKMVVSGSDDRTVRCVFVVTPMLIIPCGSLDLQCPIEAVAVNSNQCWLICSSEIVPNFMPSAGS